MHIKWHIYSHGTCRNDYIVKLNDSDEQTCIQLPEDLWNYGEIPITTLVLCVYGDFLSHFSIVSI